MKKILAIGFILMLVATSASAQIGVRRYRTSPSIGDPITRWERFQLQRDVLRYRIARGHAVRDGYTTPFERRRLHKMRQRTRMDVYRFRHNGRRRVI